MPHQEGGSRPDFFPSSCLFFQLFGGNISLVLQMQYAANQNMIFTFQALFILPAFCLLLALPRVRTSKSLKLTQLPVSSPKPQPLPSCGHSYCICSCPCVGLKTFVLHCLYSRSFPTSSTIKINQRALKKYQA